MGVIFVSNANDYAHHAEDVAYVQDVAFKNLNQAIFSDIHKYILSYPELNIAKILDLGCGAGNLCKEFIHHNYQTSGVDISPYAIKRAEDKCPEGKFYCKSFFDMEMPASDLILATNICLNYLHTEENHYSLLKELFIKISEALHSKGLFIFDILINKEISSSLNKESFIEESDWAMFTRRKVNLDAETIQRDIVIFRKVNDLYRKTSERHLTKLYILKNIKDLLDDNSFSYTTFHSYNSVEFSPEHVGFICSKN